MLKLLLLKFQVVELVLEVTHHHFALVLSYNVLMIALVLVLVL